MRVNEPSEEVSIVLLICAANLDPDIVTRSLHQFPDESWRKDAPLPMLVAHGLPARAAGYGCWKKCTPPALNGHSLEEQLTYWIELFSDRASELSFLSSLDYKLTLECYVAGELPIALELPSSLLAALGTLHLDLEMHVFERPAVAIVSSQLDP